MFEGKERARTPEEVAAEIHAQTDSFTRKAAHLQRLPLNRVLHKRLREAAEDVCDFLTVHLEKHARVTNGVVVGASAHSLSLMQVSQELNRNCGRRAVRTLCGILG